MATLVTANTATGGISIAYDYTQELSAITAALSSSNPNEVTQTTATVQMAGSLAQIATNSISVVSSLASINTNLAGINFSLSRIANSIETLTTLSTSTGIRINDPSAFTTLIDLYDWYITQENPLETSSFTSTEFVNFVQAVSSITNYMPRFK